MLRRGLVRQRGFDSRSLRNARWAVHWKVGRAARHSLGTRRSGREISEGSIPSPSAGGFGMARQAALNAAGSHGAPGGSTPSPSALLPPPWKGGHVVWHAASKVVGVQPQGVRFPPLPPSVRRPVGRAVDCIHGASAHAGRRLYASPQPGARPSTLGPEAAKNLQASCRERRAGPPIPTRNARGPDGAEWLRAPIEWQFRSS